MVSRISVVLDDADPDPRHIAALLDGIPGARERIEQAEAQVQRGETIGLDEL